MQLLWQPGEDLEAKMFLLAFHLQSADPARHKLICRGSTCSNPHEKTLQGVRDTPSIWSRGSFFLEGYFSFLRSFVSFFERYVFQTSSEITFCEVKHFCRVCFCLPSVCPKTTCVCVCSKILPNDVGNGLLCSSLQQMIRTGITPVILGASVVLGCQSLLPGDSLLNYSHLSQPKWNYGKYFAKRTRNNLNITERRVRLKFLLGKGLRYAPLHNALCQKFSLTGTFVCPLCLTCYKT